MTLARWMMIAIVACALPRVARADDPPTRAAKKHFDKGEKQFALGKFDLALDEYQRAFDAKPIPAFLFNIGQCYRNLGDFEQAIFSYQKFLKLDPDAPNRESVQALIDDLTAKQEARLAARATAPPPQPPPSTALPPPATATTSTTAPIVVAHDHPFYTRWWFWTGVAVIGLAGGGAAYAETRGGAPATTLGNIVFGK